MNNILESIDPYQIDIDTIKQEENMVDEAEVEPAGDMIISQESFTEGRSTDNTIIIAGKRPSTSNVFIRSSDGKHFRIYFADTEIVFEYATINKLCRFLDTRTEDQTVEFFLGVEMSCPNEVIWVSSVLSTLMTCKARTIARAFGCCSLAEVMIWTYCKERTIARYGALTFNKPDIKTTPQLADYFEMFFNRIQDLGVLTAEEKDMIYQKNIPVMKYSDDIPSFKEHA